MVKREKAKIEEDDAESFLARMRQAMLIDKHGLDEMWVEQPGLYLEVAERLALEISLRDEAKDAVNDIIAELDPVVREAHADDEKKPTETAIKNEIAADRKVVRAKENMRQLERNVGVLSALRDAFSQRRYALQDLTSLHLGGYYQSNSGAARGAREATHGASREAMQAERVKAKKKEN